MTNRRYPPFTQLGMLSLALIVAGGIYLASHLPEGVPLGPAIALLVASGGVSAYNLNSLRRVQDFAWERFFYVAKWALLAYLISAAMIEYAFLRNHVSGGPLVILTLSLLVYAAQVPSLIAFTVARYATPDSGEPGRPAARAARPGARRRTVGQPEVQLASARRPRADAPRPHLAAGRDGAERPSRTGRPPTT